MKLTQEVDFLQERQVPAPCQLWVREEAFREGVIQCDLLRLSSKGRPHIGKGGLDVCRCVCPK